MTELMTLEEVANYLRVTKRTMYRAIKEGKFPAIKVRRRWRFEKNSIDQWLHQNSTKTLANILVIDDDETIGSLFKDTLEEAGHTVTTVSESSKGLELVKNQHYDLVFLDLKIPGIDGAELFRQIKVVKPNLPVTIITGYPDSDLMTTALASGPFSVMNKPFRESDIMTAVNNYLHFSIKNK